MALFISKKRELRIIVKPSDRTFDEARRPVIIRGERVEFFNHRFQSDDPGLTEWLCRHPLCGSHFICADPAEAAKAREKAPPAPVTMIVGANTTAAKAMDETVEDKTIVVERPSAEPQFETPITKDEIEIMIDNKLDGFFERIVSIVQSQAASKAEALPKQKKTFKCPHCEEVFKSGIDVGKHKKLVHQDKL